MGIDDNQVLDFSGTSTKTDAPAPLDPGAPPQTAPEDNPKQPDGEVKSDPEGDPNAHPGSSEADPNNLAKDAQAAGGLPPEKQAGATSLGQQTGSAGVGVLPATGDERAVQEAVANAPKPEGKVRTSWADQGHSNE